MSGRPCALDRRQEQGPWSPVVSSTTAWWALPPLVCLAVSDHSAGGSVSGVPGSRVAGRQHLRTYG